MRKADSFKLNTPATAISARLNTKTEKPGATKQSTVGQPTVDCFVI